MWREIVTYNSSVLVLNVEIIKNGVAVNFSFYVYEPQSNKFVVTFNKRQIIQSLQTDESRILYLGCKVILDYRCGVFLPFLLTQDHKHCYFFCLDPSNEWILTDKFAVPEVLGKRVQLCDASYFIENGPTLIWTVGNELFIFKSEYLLDLDKPAPKLIADAGILRVTLDSDKGLVHTCRILWWSSGTCTYEQGMIVVKDNKAQILNSYLITVDNKTRKANVLNRPIIPFLYLAITSCTMVIPEHSPSIKAPNDISYRVFISTTQNQLLEFYNGKYTEHIDIPFSSCQNIQIFENSKGNLILLCSQEDKICAVDWVTSKILRTYHVFSKILIDDFIGLGTSQILLLHGLKHEGHQILDNFIISDFCAIDVVKEDKKDNVSSSSETIEIKSERDENSVDNVVNALLRKIQATKISIMDCEMEKSEKSSFVKRHCESLHNMLVDEFTSHLIKRSGLVQLVNSEDTDEDDLRVQSSTIIVHSKWQDFTSSEWIIGLQIENVAPRTVSDLSLCIVNKTSGTLRSSTSKIKLSSVQSRNQDGNILSSGQRATIIAVTPLPNFSFERHFTVGLMVTWKHAQGKCLSQFCGHMTLRIDYFITNERKKCWHLTLCPLKTQVLVSNTNCDIHDVVAYLKSNMDVCEYTLVQKCYHLRWPLTTAHLSWSCENNDLVMSIFTRDYNQLFLCLRQLRLQLPDELSWHPLGTKVTLQYATESVKSEVSFWISQLINVLVKTQTAFRPGATEDCVAAKYVAEISAKRRRISQHEDGACKHRSSLVHIATCQKTFLDICSNICNTENIFLTLLFLQNKS